MTNFAYLSEDKLVQSVSYGKDIKIIVNFSNEDMEVEKTKIKAKSAYIDNQGRKVCIRRLRNNKVKYTVFIEIL